MCLILIDFTLILLLGGWNFKTDRILPLWYASNDNINRANTHRSWTLHKAYISHLIKLNKWILSFHYFALFFLLLYFLFQKVSGQQSNARARISFVSTLSTKVIIENSTYTIFTKFDKCLYNWVDDSLINWFLREFFRCLCYIVG